MTAVERAATHAIEQLERLDHRTGRQHFDLEVTAGHAVDLAGKIERVFVEMSLAGQVDCQRMLIGAALEIIGNPSAAAPPADAAAAARKLRRVTARFGVAGSGVSFF